MQIDQNSVVSIHYTLTNDEGTVIDSSINIDPLVYLQGAGNIIPGLENALVGKCAGDTLTVRIAPEDCRARHDISGTGPIRLHAACGSDRSQRQHGDD